MKLFKTKEEKRAIKQKRVDELNEKYKDLL